MKNYGFQRPLLDDTQYRIFGANALPKTVLQLDGDWTPYLPKYERQFGTSWDSYGCTVFGTLNALETLMKRLYSKEFDYSERYIYNLAGVIPPGHDPHDIAEKIRKEGVLEQNLLPFIDSLKDFAKPRPMTKEMIDKGHVWLNRFDFKHEWLWTDDLKDISKRHKLLKEYLKYSPLGISVTAWKQNENGEYTSDGQDNTHWCMAFKIDDQNRVYVFDSYDQEIKILTADHDIQFAKRYNIREKSPEEQLSGIKVSLISLILNYVKSIINKTSKGFGGVIDDIFSKRID